MLTSDDDVPCLPIIMESRFVREHFDFVDRGQLVSTKAFDANVQILL
jgi:hypothetical protein